MNTTQHQFIYDSEDNKTFALLPIAEYETMLEALEETHDVLLYDQAKRKDEGTYISLEEIRQNFSGGA